VNTSLVDRLRAQCDGPRDGALLRFSLGNALLDAGDHAAAVEELRRAVSFDPHYSWRRRTKPVLPTHGGRASPLRSSVATSRPKRK
jgi:hypothetical protein